MKDTNFKIQNNDFDKIHQVAKKLPEILSNQLKSVSTNSLLDKIFVSRPYFAFSKIYQHQEVLIAPIQAEQPMGFAKVVL